MKTVRFRAILNLFGLATSFTVSMYPALAQPKASVAKPATQKPAAATTTTSSPSALPPTTPTSAPSGLPPTGHVYALHAADDSAIALPDEVASDQEHELYRNMGDQMNVIKTRFEEAEIDDVTLAKLGVRIDPRSPILKPSDEAIVLDAWKRGLLLSATVPTQIVTRENTCRNVVLIDHANRSKTTITYVPRVTTDGNMVIELIEPTSVMASGPSGDTLVVVLLSSLSSKGRFLFMTPRALTDR